MPGWLLSILQSIAPTVITWALSQLEKRWPGVGALIKSILDYIGSHPQGSAVAIETMNKHIEPLVGASPSTKSL